MVDSTLPSASDDFYRGFAEGGGGNTVYGRSILQERAAEKSAGPSPDTIQSFKEAAVKYNVPADVLMSIAEKDSNFNEFNRSRGPGPKVRGIINVTDEEAASREGGNPYDASQNIDTAARKLRTYLDSGMSIQDAVKAHAGGSDPSKWSDDVNAYAQDVLSRTQRIAETYIPEAAPRVVETETHRDAKGQAVPPTVEEQRQMFGISDPGRPGVMQQLGEDVQRGTANLANLGRGLKGMAQAAVGDEAGAKATLDEYVKREYLNARENPAVIGSYKNIKDLGDAGRYAIEAVGENAAMFLPALATGGVGAGVGRAITERAAARFIEDQIAKGVTREAAEQAAAQMVEKAITVGAAAGAAPSTMGMETGSIGGDIYKETGQVRPGVAAVGGAAAGALDLVEPVMAIRKAFGPSVSEPVKDMVISAIAKRVGVEGAKQFAVEAGTEGLQTIVEQASTRSVDGKKLFTPELLDEVVDSALKGGIGGGVMGVGSQAVSEYQGRNQSVQPPVPTQQTGADRLEPTLDGSVAPAPEEAAPAVEPQTRAAPPEMTNAAMKDIAAEAPGRQTAADLQAVEAAPTKPATGRPGGEGPLSRVLGEAAPHVAPLATAIGKRVTMTDENGSIVGTVVSQDADGILFKDDRGEEFLIDNGLITSGKVQLEHGDVAPAPIENNQTPVGDTQPPLPVIGDTQAAAPPAMEPVPAPEAERQPGDSNLAEQAAAAVQPAPAPIERPLSDMSEEELRAKLKYIAEQGKVNGWSKPLTKERAKVEKAINALVAAKSAEPTPIAKNPTPEPLPEEPAAAPKRADETTIKRLLNDYSMTSKAMQAKIDNYGLNDTHEVTQNDKGRFVITPKGSANATQAPAPSATQEPSKQAVPVAAQTEAKYNPETKQASVGEWKFGLSVGDAIEVTRPDGETINFYDRDQRKHYGRRGEAYLDEATKNGVPEAVQPILRSYLKDKLTPEQFVARLNGTPEAAATNDDMSMKSKNIDTSAKRVDEANISGAGDDLSSDEIASAFGRWIRHEADIKTRKTPQGVELRIDGKHISTVKDASFESAQRAIAEKLRDKMAAEGKKFSRNPEDLSLDQLTIAQELGRIIPEFEISGDEIGGVVSDQGAGFTVNYRALHKKIQDQKSAREAAGSKEAAKKPKKAAPEQRRFNTASKAGPVFATKNQFDPGYNVSWASTHIANAETMDEAARIAEVVANSGADNIADMRKDASEATQPAQVTEIPAPVTNAPAANAAETTAPIAGKPKRDAAPTANRQTASEMLSNMNGALSSGSIDAMRFAVAPKTEELDAIIDAGQIREYKEIDSIFGEDSEKVKSLIRKGRIDQVDDIIFDKFGSYDTPEAKKVNGIIYGTDNQSVVNTESLKALRDRLSNLEFAVHDAAKGDTQMLSKELAWVAPELPDISAPEETHTETQRIAVLSLARAIEDMQSNNIDPYPILKETVSYTGKRVNGDVDDARLLLDRLSQYADKYMNMNMSGRASEPQVQMLAPPATQENSSADKPKRDAARRAEKKAKAQANQSATAEAKENNPQSKPDQETGDRKVTGQEVEAANKEEIKPEIPADLKEQIDELSDNAKTNLAVMEENKDNFLKSKRLTRESIIGYSPEQQAALNKEYDAWFKKNGRKIVNGIAEPVAEHKETGEPPEAASQDVVNETVRKASNAEKMSPSKMRDWLVGEIDKALSKLPKPDATIATTKPHMAGGKVQFSGVKGTLGEPNYISVTVRENRRDWGIYATNGGGKYGGKSELIYSFEASGPNAARKAAEALLDRAYIDEAGDTKIGDAKTVTFDVPGDGKFNVVNTVQALTSFRDRVMKSPGFKGKIVKSSTPATSKPANQSEDVAAAPPAEEEPKTNEHGPIFRQYYHDAKGAIERLMKEKAGDAVAALYHPDVGDIDLIWGEARSDESEGKGLAKIAQIHPEVLDDLQGRIEQTKIVKKSKNRIILIDEKTHAVIRLDHDGVAKHWLMTAFDPAERNRRFRDTTGRPEGFQTDTSSASPADENIATGGESGKGSTIQDAGEKIGGARKDLWKERGLSLDDLKDMSSSEAAELVTKDNVWPRPDYAKLIEGGSDPVATRLIKSIYDRLSKNPRIDNAKGRENFITMMNLIRKYAERAKTVDDIRRLAADVRAELGMASKMSLSLSPEQKAAKEVNFSVYKNRQDPLVVKFGESTKAVNEVAAGWPTPAKKEAWERSYDIVQSGYGFAVRRKGGNMRMSDFFKTREEAEAFAKEHFEANKNEDGRVLPERPHLDKLERTGKNARLDRDVDSQDFINDFGFRGIEFGNYVASDERQKVVNLAYDALIDLADIVGIPPKALSLNGTLGLAFGARGKGSAKAHYEPGKLVINMTKLSGAGALAHEWAHGLDHYLGELDTDTAYQGRAKGASGWYEKPRVFAPEDGRRLKNLRPELSKAFDGVMQALFHTKEDQAEAVRQAELRLEQYQARLDERQKQEGTFPSELDILRTYVKGAKQKLAELRGENPPLRLIKSSFAKEASKLSGKTGDYWKRPTEMFARSFESFVFDKIKELGNQSDYLVYGVEEGRYANPSYKGNPYPTGAERAAINEAFQNLVDTFKVREGKNGPDTALYSVGEQKPANPMTATELRETLTSGPDAAVISAMIDSGKVVIHKNEQALRDALDVTPTVLERHATTRAEASKILSGITDKILENSNLGIKGIVSRKSIKKIVDNTAVHKSASQQVHFEAAANIELLFANSQTEFTHPDRDNDPNISKIHRALTPFMFEGKAYLAKITLKEMARSDQPNPIYSIESIDVEKTPARKPEDSTVQIFGSGPTSSAHAGAVINLANSVALFNAGKPNGNIQAVTLPDGSIHIVADNLDASNAYNVALHEVFHSGVASLVGEKVWKNLLSRLETIGRNPSQGSWAAKAKARADAAGTTAKNIAEEIGAYAVEDAENAPAGIREIADKLMGAVKAFMLRKFGMQIGQITPSQLRALTVAALRSSKAMGTVRTIDGVRYSIAGNEKAAVSGKDKPVLKRSKDRISDIVTTAMSGFGSQPGKIGVLALTPVRPLFTELSKGMPAARQYIDAKQAMDAFRNEMNTEDGALLQSWVDWAKQNIEANTALVKSMFDTTLEQYDPAGKWRSLPKPAESVAELIKSLKEEPSNEWKSVVLNSKSSGSDILSATDNEIARIEKAISEIDRSGVGAATEKRVRELQDLAKSVKIIGNKAYENIPANKSIQKQFDALPDKAKEFYAKIRDAYTKRADAMEEQVVDNVQKALEQIIHDAERKHTAELQRIKDEGLTGEEKDAAIKAADKALLLAQTREDRNRKARVARLRKFFESNRLKGPYFPLARFGNYFLTLRDKEGKVLSFEKFETVGEQRAAAEAYEKEYGKDAVQVGAAGLKTKEQRNLDANFVTSVDSILEKADVPIQVRDQIYQSYLETLPDLSMRKHQLHRKGRKGFNEDAVRSFAHVMFHSAHQLARLRYVIAMQDHLAEAETQIKNSDDPVRTQAIYNEMVRAHDFAMNPEGSAISYGVTSAVYLWTMAANVSTAFVNLFQSVNVGIPNIAFDTRTSKKDGDKITHVGMIPAGKALAEATRDFIIGKGSVLNSSELSDEERIAVRTAYESGLIDTTQAHDLAGIAEKGFQYTLNKYRGAWSTAMRWASLPMHHTERANREVTFLAAYRVARKAGLAQAEAIKTAEDQTWSTHFDNQSSSKPRVARGEGGRMLLALRSYQINLLYRIFRDLHQSTQGLTPEERQVAGKRFVAMAATTAAVAGIRGAPFYGALMMLAGVVFGLMGKDDDDPEEALRKIVAEMAGDTDIGRAVAGMFLDGLPGYWSGTSLTDRIGMGDLWFRGDDRDNKSADQAWIDIVSELLGAPGGLAKNALRGAYDISSGNYERGIEKMLPASLKNIAKAWRYGTQGVQDKNGNPIVENVPVRDMIKQALGFTPAEIADRFARNTFENNMQDRIKSKASDARKAVARAIIAGDTAAEVKARAKVDSYNEKYPESPILPKSIMQSARNMERRSGRMDHGIDLDPKLRERIEGRTAPSIYAR